MPSTSHVIAVNASPSTFHGRVIAKGEWSAWVELNACDRSVHGPYLGHRGELSLCESPAAMRELAEAILLAVDDAERLPGAAVRY